MYVSHAVKKENAKDLNLFVLGTAAEQTFKIQ